MVELSHNMKQDTSITSNLHCIKQIIAVCLGFLCQQLKNTTKKQSPQRVLLPHKNYGCSTSQEIPCLLENLKGDYHYKNSIKNSLKITTELSVCFV